MRTSQDLSSQRSSDMEGSFSPLPVRENTEHSLDDTEYWRKVKAETGFDSYLAFLKSEVQNTPHIHLQNIKDYLERHSGPQMGAYDGVGESYCTMVELSKSGTIAKEDISIKDSDPTNASHILHRVRSPTSNVQMRVILIDLFADNNRYYIPHALLDAIGLGLRVEATTWNAYFEDDSHRRRHLPKGSRSGSYMVIGDTIVTVARDYLPQKSASPPVVLIVKSNQRADMDLMSMDRRPTKGPAAEAERVQHNRRRFSWDNALLTMSELYVDLLKIHVGLAQETNVDTNHTIDINHSIACGILPILEMEMDHLKSAYDGESRSFFNLIHEHKKGSSSRYSELYYLRSCILDLRQRLEQSFNGLTTFFRSQDPSALDGWMTSHPVYRIAESSIRDFQELESQIRDWLQLEVGNLALQESKKSMELSNFQIEESKRVKIVTILAFVYVPLNLATSLFGMNIQQFNNSGQSIWTFILTAILALFLTGSAWAGIEFRRSYHAWRQQHPISPNQFKPTWNDGYDLRTRTILLAFLFMKGHWRWTWQTNAWICILTNKPDLRIRLPPAGEGTTREGRELYQSTTLDYIYKHAYDDRFRWFDPSTLYPPQAKHKKVLRYIRWKGRLLLKIKRQLPSVPRKTCDQTQVSNSDLTASQAGNNAETGESGEITIVNDGANAVVANAV